MVADGLDRDLVLAELNKFEFNYREEASKPQRGLDLIGKAMTGLKYDSDPIDSSDERRTHPDPAPQGTQGGLF